LCMHNGSTSSSPQTLAFSVSPYLLSPDDVVAYLKTDIETGLTDTEVTQRQSQYGPNAVFSLQIVVNSSWREEEE
jgi:hypothetical protein